MNTQQVKSQIKRLAKEFDLKYNPSLFKYTWISVRHEILAEYLGLCPDPIYQKYGKTSKDRIKNIDKFINSKDFQKCLKRYGGQVMQKSELKQNEKWAKQIQNKELKNELLGFYRRLKEIMHEAEFLALLTTPRNKKERDWQLRSCLRHEWIHVLLYANKIQFQEINRRYWAYDEGINEYMGAFLDEKLGNLENIREKERYPMEKRYFVYAVKFRELLRGKESPKERKKAIRGLIKRQA